MGSGRIGEGEFEPFFTAIAGRLPGKEYGCGAANGRVLRREGAKGSALRLFGEGLIRRGAPDEDARKAFGSAFAGF